MGQKCNPFSLPSSFHSGALDRRSSHGHQASSLNSSATKPQRASYRSSALDQRSSHGHRAPNHNSSATTERSFAAQHLANTQAGAVTVVENKKLVVVAAGRGIVKAPVKETKLKIKVKSKPEIIIEISPDTHEVMKENLQAGKKKEECSRFMKKVQCLLVIDLGNSTGDYKGLTSTLSEGYFTTVVARVSCMDWFCNAVSLLDSNYWKGTLRLRPLLIGGSISLILGTRPENGLCEFTWKNSRASD